MTSQLPAVAPKRTMASDQQPPAGRPVGLDTLQLASAVAALQSDSTTMAMLASVPQTLEENPAQSAPAANTTTSGGTTSHTSAQVSTTQPAGSGSDEQGHETPVRSTTPELSHHSEEETDRRLARSRERNREHARRTRLRKKAQLEALQSKARGLEAERQVLKQNLEECGIASILLGLSSGMHETQESVELDSAASNGPAHMVELLAKGKRKRFLSESMAEQHALQAQSLSITIDGEVTTIGGARSQINWKTGTYRDEHGQERQLTSEQLEDLRRERNRMHAKMTRDRKKCFIATIEKTIQDLQSENDRMKSMLSKLSGTKYSQLVTPMSSPELSSMKNSRMPEDLTPTDDYQNSTSLEQENKPNKRICHGFSLDK